MNINFNIQSYFIAHFINFIPIISVKDIEINNILESVPIFFE